MVLDGIKDGALAGTSTAAPKPGPLPKLPARAGSSKAPKAAAPPSAAGASTMARPARVGETSKGAAGGGAPPPAFFATAPEFVEEEVSKDERVAWEDFFDQFEAEVIRPAADFVDMRLPNEDPTWEQISEDVMGEVAESWLEAGKDLLQKALTDYNDVFLDADGKLGANEMKTLAMEWQLSRPWEALDDEDKLLVPKKHHRDLEEKIDDLVLKMGL